MKTIILPGFSVHNKDWALEIKKNLSFKQSVLVHEWTHWRLGGTLRPKHETGRILKEVGRSKIDVIAKSVGTMVVMHLLAEIPDQINKIILCGIPSVSEERKKLFTAFLSVFPVEKIIVFQNTKDPLASFEEVKDFMNDVNPKIKVIKKERSDHNYPYFEDFINYLTS